MSTTEEVLNEVRIERAGQQMLWGVQNHWPERWLSILGEEFGEVCRAVCEERYGEVEGNYREELIHVAAVAVQMIECFDRSRK